MAGVGVYIVIPFAGGKHRTLANSLLFTIQYTIIFGLVGFSRNSELREYLENVVQQHSQGFQLGGTISSAIKKIAPGAKIFCGCLILLSWFLFYITIRWWRHERKCLFLQNDVDYLDRNPRGAPDYYDDCEYFSRNESKTRELLDRRGNKEYIDYLDEFDPLSRIEKRGNYLK